MFLKFFAMKVPKLSENMKILPILHYVTREIPAACEIPP